MASGIVAGGPPSARLRSTITITVSSSLFLNSTGMMRACAPWLADLVTVGLDTGLRRSNLVGLERSWLQERGTVLVIPGGM